MQSIKTYFLFEGCAEEAINTYLSIFEDSKLIFMMKYDKNGPGKEGTVMQAVFQIKGIEFMAIDSHVKHDFPFTARVSQFVTCNNEKEIDKYYQELSKDGGVLMELGNYGFSKKFAWVNDKFGVSWQLNLP